MYINVTDAAIDSPHPPVLPSHPVVLNIRRFSACAYKAGAVLPDNLKYRIWETDRHTLLRRERPGDMKYLPDSEPSVYHFFLSSSHFIDLISLMRTRRRKILLKVESSTFSRYIVPQL